MIIDMECGEQEYNISPDWGYFVNPEEWMFTIDTTCQNIPRQPLYTETRPTRPLIRNKSIIMKVLEYIKRLTLIEKIYLIILNLFTNR